MRFHKIHTQSEIMKSRRDSEKAYEFTKENGKKLRRAYPFLRTAIELTAASARVQPKGLYSLVSPRASDEKIPENNPKTSATYIYVNPYDVEHSYRDLLESQLAGDRHGSLIVEGFEQPRRADEVREAQPPLVVDGADRGQRQGPALRGL